MMKQTKGNKHITPGHIQRKLEIYKKSRSEMRRGHQCASELEKAVSNTLKTHGRQETILHLEAIIKKIYETPMI